MLCFLTLPFFIARVTGICLRVSLLRGKSVEVEISWVSKGSSNMFLEVDAGGFMKLLERPVKRS